MVILLNFICRVRGRGYMIEKILNDYYENNTKKLNILVDKILFELGFGFVDRDDFYSLADEIFFDVIQRYDKKRSFDKFLSSCLKNKFKTEMTRRNRQKRQADRMSISIYNPIGDEEGLTIEDMIPSNVNIEKEVIDKDTDIVDEKIERYLNKLSNTERSIVEMLMKNVKIKDIKEELHITDKEYADHMEHIRQYENIKILFSVGG